MRTALPILVAAGLALSTAACQNMPWSKDKGAETGATQTGSAAPAAVAPTATPENQAVAADTMRDIQRRLSARGYDTGPFDGVYGHETQAAIRHFQKDQNLRSTGQLDEQTLAALGVWRGPADAQSGAQSGQYTPMNRRAQ